MTSALHKRN